MARVRYMMCCLLSKPKVSMTSLCSTAAPDCLTGHSKGRYGKESVQSSRSRWFTNFGMKFLNIVHSTVQFDTTLPIQEDKYSFQVNKKFTMRTSLPKLLDLQIFCIYPLHFSLDFFIANFFKCSHSVSEHF